MLEERRRRRRAGEIVSLELFGPCAVTHCSMPPGAGVQGGPERPRPLWDD